MINAQSVNYIQFLTSLTQPKQQQHNMSLNVLHQTNNQDGIDKKINL